MAARATAGRELPSHGTNLTGPILDRLPIGKPSAVGAPTITAAPATTIPTTVRRFAAAGEFAVYRRRPPVLQHRPGDWRK